MIKKVLVLFFLLVTSLGLLAHAEEKYVPEQLVLIHGFGPSKPNVWKDLKTNIDDRALLSPQKYFDVDNLIHVTDGYSHPAIRQGSIETYGSFVKNECDRVKATDTLTAKASQKLVAYSMGGLATRWASRYLDVERHVYIGSPHLGTPLASALWLLKESDSVDFKELLRNVYLVSRNGLYSKINTVSNPFVLFEAWKDFQDYQLKLQMLLAELKKQDFDAWGGAVADMRVTEGASYFKEFMYYCNINEAYAFLINKEHGDNENLKSLYRTSCNKTLAGSGGFWSKAFAWGLQGLIDLVGEHDFYFPYANSFADLKTGDGVVPFASQTDLGCDTIVNSAHSNETKYVDEILSLIDDAPVIERLRVLDAPGYARGGTYNAFLTFKVKEYFLADLEIDRLTVDGSPIDLSAFREPKTGAYKPYVKFGQQFLEGRSFAYNEIPIRDYNWNPIHFEPGEFYVLVRNMSAGVHTVNIVFKNPAGHTTPLTFQFSRPVVSDIVIPAHTDEWGEVHYGCVCQRSGFGDDQHTEDCVRKAITVTCKINDPLFDDVLCSVETHVSNMGSYRRERLDQVLFCDVVRSRSTVSASMDGSQSYYEQLSRDLFISAIGTNGGLPVISLNSSQIKDGCKVSVMGTNYDQYQSHYAFVLYRCDPTFMQSPSCFAKKLRVSPHRRGMEEKKLHYLTSLGVVLHDEHEHEDVSLSEEQRINSQLGEGTIKGKFFHLQYAITP